MNSERVEEETELEKGDDKFVVLACVILVAGVLVNAVEGFVVPSTGGGVIGPLISLALAYFLYKGSFAARTLVFAGSLAGMGLIPLFAVSLGADAVLGVILTYWPFCIALLLTLSEPKQWKYKTAVFLLGLYLLMAALGFALQGQGGAVG